MLHHLDISSLFYNLFTDAILSRQLLMTVRSCYLIDICPERHLFRIYLYLSKDRFSLSLELVKERERLYLKDLAKY